MDTKKQNKKYEHKMEALIMGVYQIRSYRGTGRYLNVSGTKLIEGRRNVTTYDYTNTDDQFWLISTLGIGVLVRSMNNPEYMLNANTSTTPWNCDVMTENSDSQVTFELTGGTYSNLFRIRLKNDTTKYLTAGGKGNGDSVYWSKKDDSSDAQVWEVTSAPYGSASLPVYAKVTAGNDLTSAQKTANAKFIYDYLTKRGFTKAAACAVIGNIEVESYLNPGEWEILNNTDSGYGFFQVTKATRFFNRAYAVGQLSAATKEAANALANSSPRTLAESELAFCVWECTCAYGGWEEPDGINVEDHTQIKGMTFDQFRKSTRDVETLSLVFCDYYERPRFGEAHPDWRKEYAKKWFDTL